MPIVTVPGGQRFSLARALVISLVAHMLVLWPAPPTWTRMATAPLPLLVTLRPVLPAHVASHSVVASHVARRPVARHDAATTGQTSLPQPIAPIATATSDWTRDAKSRSDNGASAPLESPALPSALPVASSLAASDGIDPEGLRGYRLALAREARRHKHYPAQAIEAGWAGTVELRVSVRAGGGQTASLATSSGHAALDSAALDMMRRALPATPLPPTLQGQTFEVSLPVLYELPD